MQSARRPIPIHVLLPVLALLLTAVGYFSAYLALVEREPVYYGNKLVQFRLAIPEPDGSVSYVANPTAMPDREADTYRPGYGLSAPWVATLFAPAHWLDSKLRPGFWPPAKPYYC